VFAAGFLLGSIRVPFLVPRLGDRLAELLEMPPMAAVIWFACADVMRRFALPPRPAIRAAVGLSALALLVCAELLLAVALADRTLGQYLAGRDPVSGTVYLCMLALFAALPWLRLRR
jgi:hypothetical protein